MNRQRQTVWLSLRDVVLGREARPESARAGEAGVIPCSRVSGTGGSWSGERALDWLLTVWPCVWGHKALDPDRGTGGTSRRRNRVADPRFRYVSLTQKSSISLWGWEESVAGECTPWGRALGACAGRGGDPQGHRVTLKSPARLCPWPPPSSRDVKSPAFMTGLTSRSEY